VDQDSALSQASPSCTRSKGCVGCVFTGEGGELLPHVVGVSSSCCCVPVCLCFLRNRWAVPGSRKRLPQKTRQEWSGHAPCAENLGPLTLYKGILLVPVAHVIVVNPHPDHPCSRCSQAFSDRFQSRRRWAVISAGSRNAARGGKVGVPGTSEAKAASLVQRTVPMREMMQPAHHVDRRIMCDKALRRGSNFPLRSQGPSPKGGKFGGVKRRKCWEAVTRAICHTRFVEP
jgi:hypothetical protein